MTDFLIMSAAFLILIPSSWPNEINGLDMRMRKAFLIGLSHHLSRKSAMKTVRYAQNMRRVGKPPYYVWGGQPAGLASPPIRRGVSARAGLDAPCKSRSDDGGPVPPSTRPPSSSTRAANQKRRPPMADLTLATSTREAIPDLPVAHRADRDQPDPVLCRPARAGDAALVLTRRTFDDDQGGLGRRERSCAR